MEDLLLRSVKFLLRLGRQGSTITVQMFIEQQNHSNAIKYAAHGSLKKNNALRKI